MRKKLGVIINPVAGIGGSVGLKGSDGLAIQQEAFSRGAIKRSADKVKVALTKLLPLADKLTIYAGQGEMGANLATSMGFTTVIVPLQNSSNKLTTTAADTEAIAKYLAALPVDVLLFAGGDGTARNICASVPAQFPVIGIPAGVKIHSAVYATSPAAASRALFACMTASVPFHEAEVIDINEEEYRAGRLKTSLYGYLSVPLLQGVMQNPKAASHLSPNDISGLCYDVAERITTENSPCTCYIFGAGSTVKSILHHMGHEGSLLGIDVLQNGKFIAQDATEADLLAITQQYPCRLILTVIGGQGHIFGRGNQQLSPAVIKHIGLDNILIVAAASKIYSLANQNLFVDTGDEALNEHLRGYRRVIVGYQNTLVCQVF